MKKLFILFDATRLIFPTLTPEGIYLQCLK